MSLRCLYDEVFEVSYVDVYDVFKGFEGVYKVEDGAGGLKEKGPKEEYHDSPCPLSLYGLLLCCLHVVHVHVVHKVNDGAGGPKGRDPRRSTATLPFPCLCMASCSAVSTWSA
jgi:hypothetical protein